MSDDSHDSKHDDDMLTMLFKIIILLTLIALAVSIFVEVGMTFYKWTK